MLKRTLLFCAWMGGLAAQVTSMGGLRHLILMLSYNLRKTFYLPGMFLAAPSALAILALGLEPRSLLGVTFDVGSMLALTMFFLLGTQPMLMA